MSYRDEETAIESGKYESYEHSERGARLTISGIGPQISPLKDEGHTKTLSSATLSASKSPENLKEKEDLKTLRKRNK